MKIFLLLLLSAPCLADGPRYRHKEPLLDDEVRSIYHSMDSILKGDVRISSVTIGTAVVQNLYATVSVTGRIVQSSMTLISGATITSTSYVGMTASSVTVTPTATSQTVRLYSSYEMGNIADGVRCFVSVFRNGTDIGPASGEGLGVSQFSGTTQVAYTSGFVYEDSPATTSAVIYSVRVKSAAGGSCLYGNFVGDTYNTFIADVIAR